MVEYRLSLQELNTVWAQHAVATPTQYFHLPNLKVVPHLRKRKAWTAHFGWKGGLGLGAAPGTATREKMHLEVPGTLFERK